MIGDELVFLTIGVDRPAVLANRQRVYQRRVRSSFDRLEQRGQEGCQLVACIPEVVHLAQVNRQFVEQNKSGFSTEQLAQGLGARCDSTLVALAYPFISIPSRESASNLAPRGVGEGAVFHPAAIGWIGVFSIERSDPDTTLRKKRGIDELGDARYILHAACGMAECDQPVRLSTTV